VRAEERGEPGVLGELEAGFQLGRRGRENRVLLAELLAEPFVRGLPSYVVLAPGWRSPVRATQSVRTRASIGRPGSREDVVQAERIVRLFRNGLASWEPLDEDFPEIEDPPPADDVDL
jgi:hypothetical protein